MVKWLNPDVLCSFGDDQVRIELGPQLIELDCTDENLRDEVTHPQYKIGGRDAYGRVIRLSEAEKPMDPTGYGVVEKGEKMHCVDWRSKHVPHLWKIYQLQDTDDVDPKTGDPVQRFIKVDEVEGRDEALKRARTIRGEM